MVHHAQSGARNSFLDGVLDQSKLIHLITRKQLNFQYGNLMEKASDTSSSTILAFIQAMIKFPLVMEKAQREMDSVVNDGRSLQWSDYAKLPYAAIIVKQTMRSRLVAPFAPSRFERRYLVVLSVYQYLGY